MARRILFIVLGLILALVAIVAIAGFFFVRTPFPDTDGTVQVPDAAAIAQSLPEAGETLQFSTLQSPVTVYRDEYGVPQIYADNLHDLFFAQGYVSPGPPLSNGFPASRRYRHPLRGVRRGHARD